jgi:hypothetical protein
MAYCLDSQGLIPYKGKMYLFPIVVAFRLAMESIQPPVQWLLEALSPKDKVDGA